MKKGRTFLQAYKLGAARAPDCSGRLQRHRVLASLPHLHQNVQLDSVAVPAHCKGGRWWRG